VIEALRMAVVTVPDEAELTRIGGGDSGGPPEEPPSGGGDGRGLPSARRSDAPYTGILLALGAILMFFMGLTSAFIVRKGTSGDWVTVQLPALLYPNTLALVLSSVLLEAARRFRARGDARAFGRLWGGATLLGALFLVGQLVAWRQLADQGVYVSTNPSSSFFYLLTAAHGAHLLGGVLALLFVARKARSSGIAVNVVSIYWHFMGALWVYLLLLLRLGG
jgi:cytochrome c oxidase subunit 3